MFARTSALFVFALPLFAAGAAVLPRGGGGGGGGGSQCNTGPIQCCNSTEDSNHLTAPTKKILQLLGISAGDITGLVGITCSPLTVIGAGGNSCTQQPVCCRDNSFHGVIALGCTPINVNL